MVVRWCAYALMTAAIVVFGLHLSTSFAFAATAPKQLYNKTIEVQWSETSMNRRLSDNVTTTPTGSYIRTIYVSSLGRVFSRREWRGPANSGTAGAGRSQAAPQDLTNRLNFSGNTMVYQETANMDVARRLSVTFDSAFSSCSASLQVGKSGPSPHWKGFDGAEYELIEDRVGSTSCAIRDGNPFAK